MFDAFARCCQAWALFAKPRPCFRRAGLVIVSALVLTGCDEPSQEAQTPPRPIAWTTVESVSDQTTRRLAGTTRAVQRAPLSFEVPGTVESVKFETGESFDEGDVMAALNTRNLQLALEQRQSERAEAKAQLTEASNDFERKDALFDKGWVSAAIRDDARAGLETAQSRVALIESRLTRAEEDLQDATLKAPYDGSVSERLIEPSQQVTAGRTVFRIQGNNGGLEVEIAAPETIVGRLDIGTEHGVIFPSLSERAFEGTITEIASEATGRNAYPVVLGLKDGPDRLKSGATAEVELRFSEGGAGARSLVKIPLTAYAPDEGKRTFAFLFQPESGSVKRVPITISEFRSDGVIVSEGLSDGDIIATKGVAFLRDGQDVTRLGVGVTRYNP